MKPKSTLRSFLAIAGSSLLAMSSASATIYYWDDNSITAGFGTAGANTGTWAAPTAGPSAGWSLSATGANTFAGFTTSTLDTLNFGTGTTALAAGIITVSGTVDAGDITFASGSGAIVLSGGTITLAAAQTTTVNNATDTIDSILAGAGTSFTKAGTGTLILTGANSYTGTTIIRGGTLNLGNSSTTGSLASTALEFQGGTLSYTRNDSATETFSTTAIKAGAAAVTADAGNTLALGDITRTAGGTLAVGTTGTITTSDTNDATGILGAWAFYGTQYATGGGTIAGYSGGAATIQSDWTSATTNYEVTATGTQTLAGSRTANTLRYSTGTGLTIALGSGSNTLTTNGILAVGTGTLAISGTGTTSLIAGSTNEIVIAGSQAVTISAPISSGAVTYSGTGALTLSGANTYAGGFTLNSGRVHVTGSTYAGFGSGTLTVTGGSISGANSDVVNINNDLNWSGSLLLQRAGGSSGAPIITFNGPVTLSSDVKLVLATSGGTNPAAPVFTNNISGAYGINVVSDGPTTVQNTLTLSGTNNTFTGGLSLTLIKGMFLNINSATALGATAGTLTIGSGGVLTIDNKSAGAITLTNNNPLAIGGNFVFTGTRDLNMGTGAVNLGGSIKQITTTAGIFTLGGVISNGGLTKAGVGTLVLTGANDYVSATAVNAGALQLSGSGQLGSGSYAGTISIAADNSSVLQYSSTVDQTLSGVISGRGAITKDTGTASTLTLSNANTFAGNVTLSAGTLKTGNAKGLGFGGLQTTAVSTTTVASGGTLDLNGTSGVNEPITLNGTGVGGNGALINSSGTPAVISNGIAGLAVAAIGSGSGYSSAPTVVISGTGTGATATASLGLTTASITTILTGGTSGWAIGDTLSVTGGNGNGAIATVTSVSSGVITGLDITNAGTGYTAAPTTLARLTGVGVGTPTFTGNATNFTVGGITLTNAGTGYTGTPTWTLNGVPQAVTPTLSSVILAADSSIGGSGTITINAVVSESVAGRALTKVGAGTVTLSGANTYTGATAVNGGTLVITGATQATSAITFGGGVLGLDTASSVTAASATVNFTGQQVLVTGATGSPSYTLLTASSITGTPTLAPGSVSGYAFQVVGGNQLQLVLSGGGDVTPPTLTSIADNVSGGPVTEDASVTYTVTFSEDIATALIPSDFNNEGTAALTINSVVETGLNTGVFTVVATPTSPGTLKLRIPAGKLVEDTSGNDLVLPVSDNTTITVKSKYEAWSGAADFDTDTNGDGVKNGLAFLLGAANKNVSALGLLPTVTQSGGNLVLTFSMLNAANRKSASMQVQQSRDLGITDAWVDSAVVPEVNGGPSASVNGVTFNVTLGSPKNTVVATVAASEAGGTGKLFGRLKANP